MPTKKTRSAPRASKSTLEWKEPPARTRNTEFTFPVDELKKHKNEWALVKTTGSPSAGSAVSYLKKQLEKREIKGFELTSRGPEVYARYTGKAQEWRVEDGKSRLGAEARGSGSTCPTTSISAVERTLLTGVKSGRRPRLTVSPARKATPSSCRTLMNSSSTSTTRRAWRSFAEAWLR